MIHSFDTDIAKMVGVNAAIVLNNIFFWTEKNRANEENIHNGRPWTYNSKKAFVKLFPYLTERQIDYAISKLKDSDMVMTGNFNKSPYDKTLWYAITDYGYSILQNCSIAKTKLSDQSRKNVEPIPDSNPDSNPNSKQDSKPPVENKQEDTAPVPYEKVKDLYNEICVSMKPCVRLGTSMKKHIKARFNEGYTMDDFKTAFEKAEASSFCKGGNKRGWKPTFSWFIEKSDNMAKVLNGKYDDNKPSDGRNDKCGGTGNFDDWNNLPNVTNL